MAESGANKTADRALHICPECGSKLVQPLSWQQEKERCHWRVWRRCPECEWVCEAVHDEIAIDAYDEQLDLGSLDLANELRALEHANMSEMAESFIQAMDGDLITADDFRV
jgi:ribosomal protein L37AE/L43A